jgi:hypothetical protein
MLSSPYRAALRRGRDLWKKNLQNNPMQRTNFGLGDVFGHLPDRLQMAGPHASIPFGHSIRRNGAKVLARIHD